MIEKIEKDRLPIQLVKLRVDAIRVVSVVTGKKIRLVGEYG